VIICLRGNGLLITENNEEFFLEDGDQIFVTKPFKFEHTNNLIIEMIWSPGPHGASMDDWRSIFPVSSYCIE